MKPIGNKIIYRRLTKALFYPLSTLLYIFAISQSKYTKYILNMQSSLNR